MVDSVFLTYFWQFFFFFNDTATTEIYTFPYTTLFRSSDRQRLGGGRHGHRASARRYDWRCGSIWKTRSQSHARQSRPRYADDEPNGGDDADSGPRRGVRGWRGRFHKGNAGCASMSHRAEELPHGASATRNRCNRRLPKGAPRFRETASRPGNAWPATKNGSFPPAVPSSSLSNACLPGSSIPARK